MLLSIIRSIWQSIEIFNYISYDQYFPKNCILNQVIHYLITHYNHLFRQVLYLVTLSFKSFDFFCRNLIFFSKVLKKKFNSLLRTYSCLIYVINVCTVTFSIFNKILNVTHKPIIAHQHMSI